MNRAASGFEPRTYALRGSPVGDGRQRLPLEALGGSLAGDGFVWLHRVCGDTSGTRHHQLGGSYLPDRAAGEVLPDHHCGAAPTFGIPTKPTADIC
jgi:hypothetical protein